MKALILAAGYATRLYPLTRNFPKPLLHVGNLTILDHLFSRLDGLRAFDRAIVVTNDRFYPQFSAWARDRRYSDFDLRIVNDGTKSNETRLGAIADIQLALERESIRDDLLVAAGDNIFTFDFNELLNTFEQRKSDVIVVTPVSDVSRRRHAGVAEIDAGGRVIGFEEKPEIPKSEYICPALYILKQQTLQLVADYLSAEGQVDAPGHFIAWLHRRVPVYAYIMKERYYDIGTRESYDGVCHEFSRAHP